MRFIPSSKPARSPARAATALLIALSAAGLVSAPPAAAEDSGAWRANKGRIFVSDTEFGQGYASDGAMMSAMKKQSKTTIKGDGNWT